MVSVACSLEIPVEKTELTDEEINILVCVRGIIIMDGE